MIKVEPKNPMENTMKEQTKYIQTKRELAAIPAVNADPVRAGTMNEELFYRVMER